MNPPAPRDDVSTDWWDHRPAFSVSDKGSRITGLAPGRPAWHRAPHLLGAALLCFAAWAAVALLGSSVLCGGMSGECLTDVGQGWLIGGGVVLGYLALLTTVGLAERARERFGQRRAASLFYLTPLLAGITVGSGAGVALALGSGWREGTRRALDGVPGTEAVLVSAVVTVLAAVWGLVVAAQLPAALRHARQRQETIERLRRDGHRYAGTVRLGEVSFWLHNDPELDVTITYDSPAGRHEVAARMRSSTERVPKDGSKVVVLTDLRGAVHIELDPDVEHVFEPEERYPPSE
jgi:hypothetical protein